MFQMKKYCLDKNSYLDHTQYSPNSQIEKGSNVKYSKFDFSYIATYNSI